MVNKSSPYNRGIYIFGVDDIRQKQLTHRSFVLFFLSSLYKLTLILYRKLIVLISLLLLVILTTAQEKKDKKWDVNNPEGPYKEISFTVNEGTWMNLDVSPDGKDIVFDLLGDILTPD